MLQGKQQQQKIQNLTLELVKVRISVLTIFRHFGHFICTCTGLLILNLLGKDLTIVSLVLEFSLVSLVFEFSCFDMMSFDEILATFRFSTKFSQVGATFGACMNCGHE